MTKGTVTTFAVLALAGTAWGKDAWSGEYLAAAAGATGGNSPIRTGEIITFDTNEIPSFDEQGDEDNVVVLLDLGPNAVVNGIGWDVVLSATDPSWRSEISVLISDSSGVGGFVLAPGEDNSPGGPTGYSSDGITKLADYQIPDVAVLADGLLRLEFFEDYDDFSNEIDGFWESGQLFFQVIPSPASAGLLGLAAVAAIGRKRR